MKASVMVVSFFQSVKAKEWLGWLEAAIYSVRLMISFMISLAPP
jgi:hypothetical protein